jgi:hypothetical protein
MPAVDVLADDEGARERIALGLAHDFGETPVRDPVRGRRECLEDWLNANLQAGAVAVAPIEDHALIKRDRLLQAVRLDVGDQRVELGAFHQREHGGDRVGFEGSVGLRRVRVGAMFAHGSVALLTR